MYSLLITSHNFFELNKIDVYLFLACIIFET
jgi:hypothetical protein